MSFIKTLSSYDVTPYVEKMLDSHASGHTADFKISVERSALIAIVSMMLVDDRTVHFYREEIEKIINEDMAAEKAGDKTGRLIAKIFLNSLYGKFAAQIKIVDRCGPARGVSASNRLEYTFY